MRTALIACLFLACGAAGAAAQDGNCRNFSWSVGRTIDLFDEPLPTVQSAQSLPKEGVFALQLRPVADVIYMMTPERGSDGSWGAMITLENVPAGRYQIALSDDAWVEAVQDNKRLVTFASKRSKECRGVRHSVDVDVQSNPLTLQI
ncbi:MAG TPA: hypothetical protein VFF72_01805, partial [Caldimonas sp.]|nr:hypothetical protein [Caldimonas sp.]